MLGERSWGDTRADDARACHSVCLFGGRKACPEAVRLTCFRWMTQRAQPAEAGALLRGQRKGPDATSLGSRGLPSPLRDLIWSSGRDRGGRGVAEREAERRPVFNRRVWRWAAETTSAVRSRGAPVQAGREKRDAGPRGPSPLARHISVPLLLDARAQSRPDKRRVDARWSLEAAFSKAKKGREPGTLARTVRRGGPRAGASNDGLLAATTRDTSPQGQVITGNLLVLWFVSHVIRKSP